MPIDEGGIIPERLEQVLAELRAAVDAGTWSGGAQRDCGWLCMCVCDCTKQRARERQRSTLAAEISEICHPPPAAGTSSVPFPKLLYTIPTAHNPTGCTILPERRAAVYRLCQRCVRRGGPRAGRVVGPCHRRRWCRCSAARTPLTPFVCVVLCRYNLLLVEDDPYFYLQYRQGAGGSVRGCRGGALHLAGWSSAAG